MTQYDIYLVEGAQEEFMSPTNSPMDVQNRLNSEGKHLKLWKEFTDA